MKQEDATNIKNKTKTNKKQNKKKKKKKKKKKEKKKKKKRKPQVELREARTQMFKDRYKLSRKDLGLSHHLIVNSVQQRICP